MRRVYTCNVSCGVVDARRLLVYALSFRNGRPSSCNYGENKPKEKELQERAAGRT
jgi:hypothetical protein